MSIHKVEIIQIGEVLHHANADRMEVTQVMGWQCCIAKGQFKVGDKAVFIPPDFCVKTDHPSFSFLKKEGRDKERIRVRRFRGLLSQGLLINVPKELKDKPVGTNVIDDLGITRYEPPLPKSTYGNFVNGPSGLYAPKFDVENYQRYTDCLTDGEEVIVTEKLHGCNAKYVFSTNKEDKQVQFCGSRTNWLGEDEKNVWWKAFHQDVSIGIWCQKNPGKILYSGRSIWTSSEFEIRSRHK